MNLPAPRTVAGQQASAALASSAVHALIAMDFDGTLAPIVADPQAARVHPRASAALQQLVPYVGRLAVITGRPADFVVGEGGLGGLDSLVVLGHYGLERWDRGHLSAPDPVPGIATARRQLPDLLTANAAPVGTLIEDKGQALAVHVRQTADPEHALRLLTEPVRRLADDTGLVVEPGRLVLELRSPGVDKGQALQALVSEMAAADAGPTVVVFIGDDLGDVPAFVAAERLRDQGSHVLLVCSGSLEQVSLAERADLVVDGPDGVIDWLEALLAHVTAVR